jgi:hypothetical protein
MNTFDYDSFFLAVSQSLDPTGILSSIQSRNAVPGGYNYWGYNNSYMDRLIDTVIAAKSENETKRLAWQIQAIVSKWPFIPLYLSINTQVIRAEWNNYTLPRGIIEAYNRRSMLYMYKSVDPSKNVFRIAFCLSPLRYTNSESIHGNRSKIHMGFSTYTTARSAQTRSQSSSLAIGEVGDLSRRAQLYFLP